MRFNRISILQSIGLFTKIKAEDGKYHESKYFKIKAYLMYFVSVSASLRFVICQLFDQNDSRQLFIGYFFNHLDTNTRNFLSVAGDLNLKIGISFVILFQFLIVLYLPFYLSGRLRNQMHKVNFLLQNLSFKQNTNYRNRHKIGHMNYILKFNDGYVFQCLNLFPLNSKNAFNTGIQIIINVLLLIRISNILYN